MKKICFPTLIALSILVSVHSGYADSITKPHTFSAGTPAKAEEVNANFDTVYDHVNKVGDVIHVDEANQRVGIGEPSPDEKLEVNGTVKAMAFEGDGSGLINLPGGGLGDGHSLDAADGAPTEAIYVNGAGNVGIGTTSPSNRLKVEGEVSNSVATFNRVGNDGIILSFEQDGAEEGSISVSGATVSYNTTSDIRAKRNIIDTEMTIERLMKIKVRNFQFKRDDSRHTGFIAQELIAVYPEAVTKGEKEEDMWSVDYGKLTPFLVKAVQDLKKENDKLKARIDALEKSRWK